MGSCTAAPRLQVLRHHLSCYSKRPPHIVLSQRPQRLLRREQIRQVRVVQRLVVGSRFGEGVPHGHHPPREVLCLPHAGQGLPGVFFEPGAAAVLVVGDRWLVQVARTLMPRRPSQEISRLLRRARRAFSWHRRSAGFVLRLLPLVVVPLDGEEHTGAEYGHLEHNEDYRDPIHLGDFPGC